MKVKIDEYGELHVYAESGLEAYALNKWADDNFKITTGQGINMMIHTRVEPVDAIAD